MREEYLPKFIRSFYVTVAMDDYVSNHRWAVEYPRLGKPSYLLTRIVYFATRKEQRKFIKKLKTYWR